MKQIIFNIGGALSTYVEFNNKTLLIDIGKGDDFNPINDFLLPLYVKRNAEKNNSGKFKIDQLLISHPHKDHICAIEDFDEYFYSELLTTPNDNNGMGVDELINWEKISNEKDSSIIRLKEMLKGRTPPLRPASNHCEFIYYIPPKHVENDDKLCSESYHNNISIAVFLIINNHRIFLPGDLQKEGMQMLIDSNISLQDKLKRGVDVLITPHHGLKSSFSTHLFDKMKDKKTRSINIVSEKTNNPDDSRDVDTRYSSEKFCMGINNLEGGNGIDKCNQIKTSRGHIFIDYSKTKHPFFYIDPNIKTSIERFLNSKDL